MIYLRWFAHYWKKYKYRMAGVVALTIITMAAKTGLPVLLKFIIDGMDIKLDPSKLYHLIILYALLIIAETFLRFFLPFCRGTLNLLYASVIRNDYYKVFTERDVSFFKKFKTGDLLTRLTDDIDGHWVRIFWYAASGILRPLEATLVLTLTLGIMFYYSWSLTLMVFLPLPFLIYALAKTGHKLMQYTDEKQAAISNTNNILESCFSGIRVIKTTQSEHSQSCQYNKAVENRILKEKQFLKINQAIQFLSMFVNHAGSIIVIWAGSYWLVKGSISLGTLTLFLAYSNRLVEPIMTLSWFYASSKQVFKYVERLMETERFLKYRESAHRPLPTLREFKQLSFDNVSFTYDDGISPVVANLSFDVFAGDLFAITGPVASGKSTVLELIMRSIRPNRGTISLNGISIDHYSTATVAKIIGYVSQTNLLFSETIRNNLELGHSFNDAEIERALKAAMIYDEVFSFPKGIDTSVDEKGSSLSGGQKQRLCIARALIRNPKLLILDDCTAAMDANTEKHFWQRLRKYYPDLSIIISTHRPATVAMANRKIELSTSLIQ